MMDNQEAAALLIKNIGMFEQATLLLNEIGEKVDEAVNKKIQDWVKNAEWLFDEDESKGVNFVHESVEINKGGNWIACFYFDSQGEEDCSWLASYCGEGKRHYGFAFYIEPSSFDVTPAKLRKFLQLENVNYPQLQKIGFEFYGTEAGKWFIPFELNADTLATSYAGGVIEDALQPIEDGLNKVKEAWPEFARLLDATQKEFASTSPD